MISVVVPTYKEAENLRPLIDRIRASLSPLGEPWEALIVDDDSRDGSDLQVEALAAQGVPVRLIVRTGVRGLSSAVIEGFCHASGDVLVCLDADLSHPPEAIPDMLKCLRQQGADFVIASRYAPGGGTEDGWGLLRWLNSQVATALARPFTRVSDPMSGFFALPRTVFERAAALNPVGYKIGLELLVKGACRDIREVPIHFANRRFGESKLSFREQLNYLQHLMRLAGFKYGGNHERTARRSVPSPACGFEACLSCGGKDSEKAFDAAEKGFEVRRCRSCGQGYTWPPVPPEAIARYYPESYYGRENVRFNVVFETLTHLLRWRRARVIRRRVPRGAVLDVGCGRGFILSYLRSFGYESRGVEFSDTAAWHARYALGLDVHTGDFLQLPCPDPQDAVIFWHSLEHMPRPVEVLEHAAGLLKSGGLLVVAVPNFSSLQARLFGRQWFHLDIPRHYTHFSVESLQALLRRLGFEIVQTDHFSFEQNPYGWLQSLYNALGFDDNFLYTLLKNRSARTYRIRHHPLQAVLTGLLLLPLTLLSLALTLAEAALRKGGTVEVYAVKK